MIQRNKWIKRLLNKTIRHTIAAMSKEFLSINIRKIGGHLWHPMCSQEYVNFLGL